MVEVWKGPKGIIATSDGLSFGGGNWDHEGKLLYDKDTHYRIEFDLNDKKKDKSRCGKWMRISVNENFRVERIVGRCPQCNQEVRK